MKCIIGKKIGMTQIFDPNGKRVSVTLVEAGPCRVTQVKTKEIDGYQAVQLGFDPVAEKRVKKSRAKKPFKNIIEFRSENLNHEVKVGDTVSLADFREGDKVKASGISKGKGFQGVVKKHGYKGRLSVTHGTKHELRNLGSVGCQAGVRKGKGMPGRMGSDRVSLISATVVKVDLENNLLALRGGLPGNKGTIIEIRG